MERDPFEGEDTEALSIELTDRWAHLLERVHRDLRCRATIAAMPRRRALDDGHAAEVARRYVAGETIDELAAAFGCSSTAVRTAVKAAGVPFRRRSHRSREVDVDELVAAYRDGATQDELAARFGVARVTVGRRLRAAGVELRPRADSIRTAKRRT